MAKRILTHDTRSRRSVCLCVGIAASHSNLSSLAKVLNGLPAEMGLSVVALLSGDAPAGSPSTDPEKTGASHSRIAAIDAWRGDLKCPLPVEVLDQSTRLRPNCVYLAVQPAALTVSHGTLHVGPLPPAGLPAPADHFLSSLADDQDHQAIGIVLADAGTDGLLGLKSINDAGGMTILERPADGQASAQSITQIHSSGIDHILPLTDISIELGRYCAHLCESSNGDSEAELNKQIIEAIPTIADAVEHHTSHNFRHYKVTTLARRIKRRMQVLKQSSVQGYVDVVVSSRDEAGKLFRDLLISVTCFFRDPDAFHAFETQVVPKLLAGRSSEGTLRVWVAGCATGEEAYTLAMVLHESIEKSGLSLNLQIFATDLDERALQTARSGSYPISIAEDVPADRLKKFFIKRGMRYVVSKTIRDCVIFSSHNLISDPPFTKLDLISCRNLLIYLGAHLQKKLIPLFHYALHPGGYLFLGPSESMSSHKELFRTVSAKHRITQRKSTSISAPPQEALRGTLARSANVTDQSAQVDLHQLGQRIALDEFAAQWAIVDEDAQILSLSADTSPFLKLAEGSFQNNIIKMARTGLRVGLRTAFSEAKRVKRQIVHDNLSLRLAEGIQRVVVTVQPMPQVGQDSGLYYVAFQLVGKPLVRQATDDSSDPDTTLASANNAALVEQLERELANTRDDLERTVQELETANEELKSSNEELLSMNEELHSANEELETSKEEIQASNEALHRINVDLENLLRSTNIATIFLDRSGSIRSFTPAISEIYGLISSDVGRPLAQLNPNVVSMPPLPDSMVVAQGSEPIEDTIQTLDGRWFIRRVLPYYTSEQQCDGSVITFVDVTALRESEKRLEAALRGGSMSAFDIDLRNHQVWRTPDHDQLFGYPENLPEWSYQRFLEHVVPEQLEDVKQQFERCYSANSDWTLECEVIRVDGQRRWLFARGQPQRDHTGQTVRMFGTLNDITERKRIESALADSATQTRRIIDNMLGFVGVLDAEGVLLDANATALRTAGLSSDMVLGKPFWECYWWEHDAFEVARLKDAIQQARTGKAVRYDARVRMAGGVIIDIDFMLVPVLSDDGRITHLIPSGVDITERKSAEQAVRDSEAFTRSVLENMAQFAWMGDETGSLFWYNQRWYDYTGTTLEQMQGWGWQAVQHPDYVDQVTEKYKHAIEQGIEWEDTFPLRGRDGQYRWFLSRAVPIRNSEGRVMRWFGTNTDISERIGVEAELEAARRQAEAANQAKSDFLANMSHEIRTPMTAILGFADLLQANDEEQRDKVETIRRNGQFLLELINDILDLSKIEAGKIELDMLRFSPNKLVEDVCSLMHVRAVESNLNLKVEFAGSIPDVIENDPIRVRQILINLVGNAIKFTHEGSICLRLSYDAELRHIQFEVIDTGIGITTELQAKLFRPFEQGDSSIVRRYGGSGLGLAISQRLAQVLGGHITVQSEVGKGSCFTLSVPIGNVLEMKLVEITDMTQSWSNHEIAKEYGDNFLGRSTATSHVGSGQLNVRVLVVDDRRDIRFLTQHFVRQVGGEVLLAENGKQALAITDQERTAGRALDIILMDVQMPEMDGITATRHLRESNYTGPIIALTANAMDSDRQACLSAGYTDYLSKPIDATQLIDMLRRYSKSESLSSN